MKAAADGRITLPASLTRKLGMVGVNIEETTGFLVPELKPAAADSPSHFYRLTVTGG